MNDEKLIHFEAKQDALKHLAGTLSIDYSEVLKIYAGKNFLNSNVSKYEVFSEIILGDVKPATTAFLSDRCALSYHKDMRSSYKYGVELVLGWLAEDLVLKKLEMLGINVILDGKDRKREFLEKETINTNSDFLIQTKDHHKRKVELVVSWNGYWSKSDQLDIRDSKFRNMVSPITQSLLLGFEPSSNSFLCIDLAKTKDQFKWRENPAWGNKGVYTLKGVGVHLLSIQEIKQLPSLLGA